MTIMNFAIQFSKNKNNDIHLVSFNTFAYLLLLPEVLVLLLAIRETLLTPTPTY